MHEYSLTRKASQPFAPLLVAGYAYLSFMPVWRRFFGWREQGLEFWAVLTSPLDWTYTALTR